MALHLVDVSRYQVERVNPLDLAQAKAAGFSIANVALTGGRGYVSGAWAGTYLDRAATLGLGRSTYHWLDGRTPGAEQAKETLTRLRALFGASLAGYAHIVDVEETGQHGITPPTWQHVTDYVHTMQDVLGRPIAIYSPDYWWQPKRWPGSTLTPYLMTPPPGPGPGRRAHYLPEYPGDTSPAWSADYGGWEHAAILQWGVRPLPGTGDCSLSAIRDHGIWADLTGGDVLMPQADPGNAQPEAWIGPPAPAALLDEMHELGRRMARRVVGTDDVDELVRWTHHLRPDALGDPLTVVPRHAGEMCAPVIKAELDDWVSLGGSNSGCVGDSRHGTGYHRGANFVPVTDYSRRRDPNGADGPFVDWNWACAGDFRHGGTPALRAMHKAVLALLMAGAFPMIGEMIVQPDAGKPVMYWARWEGVGNLRQYTGSGHDLWSHISWYRSMADQRPNLWRSVMEVTSFSAPALAQLAQAVASKLYADLKSPTSGLTVQHRALPWQYVGGGLPAGKSTLAVLGEIHASLAALKPLLTAADDDTAVIAAVKAEVARVQAMLEEARAAEAERDTANMRAVLERLDLIGTAGVTPDMLKGVLLEVYGEAFRAAEQPPTS